VVVRINEYVPVEGELSVVRLREEATLPPAGTVTGVRRLTVTPSGAAPLQAAVRLTEELKPFSDESIIVVDFEVPGERVISPVDGWRIKSGFGDDATTVPDGVTINWSFAECDIPPLDALTVNG